jgi:hypothetical protein
VTGKWLRCSSAYGLGSLSDRLYGDNVTPLSEGATKVFQGMTEGLAPGQARKLDNAQGAFMAVSIDRLTENLYAIAHRYECNGDLVPDPDVEFIVAAGQVFPTAIDHGMAGYFRYVELDDRGTVEGYKRRGQRELAEFCITWFRNIETQQRL